MIIGLAGCVLPVIPGPPVSFAGLFILHLTKFADYTPGFLILMGSIAVIVTILDYIVPIWGTKRFGGSKAGIRGATIGLFLGIFFFPPLGIILGPFAGAIIGEATTGKSGNESFRSGMGSLMGFLTGIGLKLMASLLMSFYFARSLIL